MSESASDLDNKPSDYAVLALRGGLGAVPGVGSLLAEFASAFIPNQRLDRLVKFAEQLNARLGTVEQQRMAAALGNPEFGEIAEEAMRQAAASISDERRKQLSSVVAEALDEERRAFADSRQVLRLLGQISDLQMIVLRGGLVASFGGDDAFRKKHDIVLAPVPATLGSSQDELDRASLWDAHRQHLARLDLLRRKLRLDSRTRQPFVDPLTGDFATGSYELTPLGRLVLRSVGLTADGFTPIGDESPGVDQP